MMILAPLSRMTSAALCAGAAVILLASAAFPANAADCYAIGQKVAQQNGGTLAKATADVQNGQPVCRIVVLLPAKEGERPRRTEIVVPGN